MPTGQRYTIERKNNTKGYYKRNCQWATYKAQGRNKRNNRLVTYRGKTQPLSAWAEQVGVSYSALKIRLRSGWPVKTALTTPVPAGHLHTRTGAFALGRGKREAA